MLPDVSMKDTRVWYERDQVMRELQALGLPGAQLDKDHVVFHDIEGTARWIIASQYPQLVPMLAGDSKLDLFRQAVETFKAAAGISSVDMRAAPGLSARNGEVRIDGCAMSMALAGGQSQAHLIPIGYTSTLHGSSRYELTGLVPIGEVERWNRVMQAAAFATRMVGASDLVMRMYNGPDVKVSPVRESDLFLPDSVKQQFMGDIQAFLAHKSWYTDRNLPWTRKYLLNGPPGTGKTTMARWAASQLSLPSVALDFTDNEADGRTFSGFMRYAARMAPCLVVMDDMDKVLSGSNRTGITQHTLLTALSGMASWDGVIVVATSNSTEPFNGPMRRRFDAVVEVPLPGVTERGAYLTRILGADLQPDEIRALAEASDGRSIDDLRRAATVAVGSAMTRNALITIDDVRRSLTAE